MLQGTGNQTMKSIQLVDKRNFFLQKSSRIWDSETNSRPFFVKKNLINMVKDSTLQRSFNKFRQPSTWDTLKANYVKLQTIDPDDQF